MKPELAKSKHDYYNKPEFVEYFYLLDMVTWYLFNDRWSFINSDYCTVVQACKCEQVKYTTFWILYEENLLMNN